MKLDWKAGIRIALVLTAITTGAALAIGGANALTAETIAKNRIEKEKAGLTAVFGANATYSDAISIEGSRYLTKYWTAEIGSDSGRVYAARGTNDYGSVSLLIGVYSNFALGEMVILENTETYANALEEKYIDPYKQAEDKSSALDEVKCGATFGANLIRNMVKEAVAHYQEGGAN